VSGLNATDILINNIDRVRYKLRGMTLAAMNSGTRLQRADGLIATGGIRSAGAICRFFIGVGCPPVFFVVQGISG
jgi:hypothetical protein